MTESKESSVVTDFVELPKKNQGEFSTYAVIIPFLICCFIILKTFIYLKDKKRDGK
jgi:hypothetical protein